MKRTGGKYFARKYAAKIPRYFANAAEMAARGEHDKAGEMVWGAAILAIKTVAAVRGVKLETSVQAIEYAKKKMTDRDRSQIQSVKTLHANFYGLEQSDYEAVANTTRAWIDSLLAENGVLSYPEEE